MNVTDLMLGDWVKIKPNPYMHTYDLDKSNYDPETHPYLVVKVEQLSEFGINPIERWGDISWTVEAEIDGIDLTLEVFLNNGFMELSDGEFHIMHTNDASVCWKNGELYVLFHDLYFEKEIKMHIKDCKYVHELQHELKSIGSTKEIKI